MSACRRSTECPQYDQLVSKGGTKSKIWEHFGFPADGCGKILTQDISICKRCMRPVSAKAGSSPNLFSHLKLHHPMNYNEVCSRKKRILVRTATDSDETDIASTSTVSVSKPSTEALVANAQHKKKKTVYAFLPLSSVSSRNFTLPADAPCSSAVPEPSHEVPVRKNKKTVRDLQPVSSENVTLSVAKFLATTLQSYSLVERKEFVDMLNALNPGYELPSKKHFVQTVIPKLYSDTVEKMRRMLAGVKHSDASLTIDCWTSVAGSTYVAVTLHFIDEKWELKSFCLRCVHLDEEATPETLAEVVTDILADWGLNAKELSSCTTDNGSDMLKAVQHLNVPHIPCFGHAVNAGVDKVLQLPQLKEAVTQLKRLQAAVAGSSELKWDLAKAQECLKMDVVELPGICETRWWSTLKLCRRFLDNRLPLCQVLQGNSKKYLMPEEDQISAIEDFASATRLLMDITTTLSDEDYTTVSAILPLYEKIKKYLQPKEDDSELILKMKFETLSAFCQRYEREQLRPVLRMCTLCDPRFRLSFVDSDQEVRESAILELIHVYSQVPENVAGTVKPAKGLCNIFRRDVPDESVLKPIRRAETELDNYLAMPEIDFEDDPLTWWGMHGDSFPGLKILARKFLAVQGMSVPPERIFGTAENIIIRHRTILSPKHAEMQVFLAENKHFL